MMTSNLRVEDPAETTDSSNAFSFVFMCFIILSIFIALTFAIIRALSRNLKMPSESRSGFPLRSEYDSLQFNVQAAS